MRVTVYRNGKLEDADIPEDKMMFGFMCIMCLKEIVTTREEQERVFNDRIHCRDCGNTMEAFTMVTDTSVLRPPAPA